MEQLKRVVERVAIVTPDAPKAIGTYSQGIISAGGSDLVFTAGQIPMTPEGQLVTGSIGDQAHQVMQNLNGILRAGGTSFENVLLTIIGLKDLANFDQVDGVYRTYMSEPYPARATVEVSRLPKDVGLEILMIARR